MKEKHIDKIVFLLSFIFLIKSAHVIFCERILFDDFFIFRKIDFDAEIHKLSF